MDPPKGGDFARIPETSPPFRPGMPAREPPGGRGVEGNMVMLKMMMTMKMLKMKMMMKMIRR